MSQNTQTAKLNGCKVYRCITTGENSNALFVEKAGKFYRCLEGRKIAEFPTENMGTARSEDHYKFYLTPQHVARDDQLHEIVFTVNGEEVRVTPDQSKKRMDEKRITVLPLSEAEEVAHNDSQESALQTTGAHSCYVGYVPRKSIICKDRLGPARVAYHAKYFTLIEPRGSEAHPDILEPGNDVCTWEYRRHYKEIVLSQIVHALGCGTKTHTQKITDNTTKKEELWLLSKDDLGKDEEYNFGHWMNGIFDDDNTAILEKVDNSSQIMICNDLIGKRDPVQNMGFMYNQATGKHRLVSFDCELCNMQNKDYEVFESVLKRFPDLSPKRQQKILRILYVIQNMNFSAMIESLPIRSLPGTFTKEIEGWVANDAGC